MHGELLRAATLPASQAPWGLAGRHRILPFVPRWDSEEAPAVPEDSEAPAGAGRVLIVDDDESVRGFLETSLTALGYTCAVAGEADGALATAVSENPPEVVLLDIHLPGSSGLELLGQLKSLNRWTEVVMLSGDRELEKVRFCLRQGAYDYLSKPASLAELSQTVARAMERGRLVRQNHEYQVHLESKVEQRTRENRHARDVALLTLAKLAESRDVATGQHLERIAAFARHLTRNLRRSAYREQACRDFEDQIFRSSPLHDIGKVAIPDAILLKPGPLSPQEVTVMRTHTTIGGDILRDVIGESTDYSFLQMGMEIAYQHHERWDGSGYPAGVAGQDIALAARIVALVDAYDALTSIRPYKEALPHWVAVERIKVDRGRHFDPVIVDAFLGSHDSFQRIRAAMTGAEGTAAG